MFLSTNTFNKIFPNLTSRFQKTSDTDTLLHPVYNSIIPLKMFPVQFNNKKSTAFQAIRI